ncbi:biotin-dependent enzyme [Amycolatopsis echigonensis]|uniref:Biotin carboxyl carrier protein of acetyl-CoA carboxylase n=1 Tax=Amycolatopsis echigonensis TaxID=2576905 RepID=A0A2N3X1W2_9PSEU|nr:acetyl-CoA carboxylase [Amycolatopsis niigatensis]PKW00114.1 biotin-dependent enzyme [Amycolatopsis niigatensis]
MSQIHEVTAPIPGIYYAKESPSAPAYVEVGSQVAEGDTVGLIEVMKMFNPVTAGVAGTVVELAVEHEDAVNAGDVLVKIEVAAS